ncbi:hypothetical protein DPMN_114994 [Dreissena polymorpha]|uniref:C-type lectin domain-containing protein n=1 Tax=Dreissena polymorpha TaxID=45954 RepID=A0A9D4QSJ1_DREPO|nr:hypothetical protein DPMN_114994 [Dreissena polymorpha]
MITCEILNKNVNSLLLEAYQLCFIDISDVLSPQCGTGWSYSSSDNNCYQVVLNRPKTWSAARADCIQQGGDLLSVPGRLEQNFVQGGVTGLLILRYLTASGFICMPYVNQFVCST